jgi:hypothetical protein
MERSGSTTSLRFVGDSSTSSPFGRYLTYLTLRGMGFIDIYIYIQSGAPQIAKWVNNSNVTMVYGRYNYSIHGVYKPTYNWGAPQYI